MASTLQILRLFLRESHASRSNDERSRRNPARLISKVDAFGNENENEVPVLSTCSRSERETGKCSERRIASSDTRRAGEPLSPSHLWKSELHRGRALECSQCLA